MTHVFQEYIFMNKKFQSNISQDNTSGSRHFQTRQLSDHMFTPDLKGLRGSNYLLDTNKA